MTRPIAARRERKPQITDRLNAWALAYDSILTMTGRRTVSPDAAAVAAAILSMGTLDLTDPHLAQAAQMIGWGKEPSGHEPG